MPTDGNAPDPDQQRHRKYAVLQLGKYRRIGCGDQNVDRGMIEAAQQPFAARHRPQIIGGGKPEHRQQTRRVDRDRDDFVGGGEYAQPARSARWPRPRRRTRRCHARCRRRSARPGRSASRSRLPPRGRRSRPSCFSLKDGHDRPWRALRWLRDRSYVCERSTNAFKDLPRFSKSRPKCEA